MYEEHSPRIANALEKLDHLDDTAEEMGLEKYLQRLIELEDEYKALGMLQNILFREGGVLVDLERYEEANPILKKAIELGHSDSKDLFILQCLDLLGNSYYETEQYDEALVTFNEAECLLGLYEDRRWVGPLSNFYFIKGRTHLGLRQYVPAIESFRKASKLISKCNLDPESENWLYWDFAAAYSHAGHYRRAYRVFEKIELESVDVEWVPTYYALKCSILYNMKSSRELIKTAKHFISLGINDRMSTAWYYVGCGYHLEGKPGKSRQAFTKSMECVDPPDWDHELSSLYLSGQPEFGRKAPPDVYTYSPKATDALNRLSSLVASSEGMGGATYHEELTRLTKEFKALGMLHEILRRQGEALYTMSHYLEAIPKLKKAIKLGGCEHRAVFLVESLHCLADCLHRSGQTKKALAAYEEAEVLLDIHKNRSTGPNWGSPFYFLWYKGLTHLKVQQHDQGFKCLIEANKLDDNRGTTPDWKNSFYWDLSYAFQWKKHYRRAYKALGKVDIGLLDEKLMPRYYGLKCALLLQMKSFEELLRFSKQFISLGVKDYLSVAWLYNGVAYYRLGDKKASKSRLKKALKYPDPKGKIHAKSRDLLEKLEALNK